MALQSDIDILGAEPLGLGCLTLFACSLDSLGSVVNVIIQGDTAEYQ
jgi:hypothetical protein